MNRKTRPYLFYDTTASICSSCRQRVEAKILIKDERVFLEKWCPQHGFERVLIADDAGYYRQCRERWIKPPELPHRFATAMAQGCPWDCGLCPDHMQHSCVTVLEVTDHCNLRCPVCYAGSGPERPGFRGLEQIERMLDAAVAAEGEPDVLQISGGEPTLHPQFFDILAAARRRPIRHLMVNTNGIVLARDPHFARRLAQFGPGLEVYLQFDSLDDKVLRQLRGADLARVHDQALANLDAAGVSASLVVTLRKGLNDGEIGDLIRFGLSQSCVRGITFQPIEDAGRNEGFEGDRHRLTVSEIRRAIARQSGLFSLEDVLPVPCNPDTLAMAYALKLDGEVYPLTRYLDQEVLVGGAGNTITFERDPKLRETLVKLFSTGLGPQQQASCLSELLCCLPRIEAPAALEYRNVFRVLIVQFMDAANLDLRVLKKSCVHMVQPDGRMIPFEAFNLFYRNPP
ncbi:MAG: radical SAM protein [Methylococcaceae bacterium]|nr:radical SAM protein [Methylococcaceae bacterium]